MSDIAISLGIPHTPWRPERVESLRRLKDELGIPFDLVEGNYDITTLRKAIGGIRYREFRDRAPNRVWSEELWTWLAECEGASHCLVLQDDVEVVPGMFWKTLERMLRALPDQVIGLAAVLPTFEAFAQEGHHWVSTSEHVIGWAYVVPQRVLRHFLTWRRTALQSGALDAITEDTLFGAFCLDIGCRVYHPLPTIVQHDTSLASEYGNDAHQNRRSVVTWERYDLGSVDYEVESVDAIPHMGLGYSAGNIVRVCAKWVKGFDEEHIRVALADNGMEAKRRLTFARRARGMYEKRAKVFLATPLKGRPHMAYAKTVSSCLAYLEADLVDGTEIIGLQSQEDDVIQTRSRFLRVALETDCTHVWFLDADVSCGPECLAGMLAAGHDIVCTPYARRDENKNRPMVGVLGEKFEFDDHFCAKVRWAPIGCCLIARGAIERMIDTYRGDPSLVFEDRFGEMPRETVALFLPTVVDRRLPSEDQAFLDRARRIGIPVHVYFGPGSPAAHWGDHCYTIDLEAFGLKKVPA